MLHANSALATKISGGIIDSIPNKEKLSLSEHKEVAKLIRTKIKDLQSIKYEADGSASKHQISAVISNAIQEFPDLVIQILNQNKWHQTSNVYSQIYARALIKTNKVKDALKILWKLYDSGYVTEPLLQDITYCERIVASDNRLKNVITPLVLKDLYPWCVFNTVGELDRETSKIVLKELKNKHNTGQLHPAILFSFYKLQNKLGMHEDAFVSLRTANKEQKKLINYNLFNEKALFGLIKASQNHFQRLNLCDKDDMATPIFIVGMPRSGTSLLEKYISSSADVTNLGELEYLSQAITDSGYDFKGIPDLTLIRNLYLNRIEARGISTRYFTDKMPLNFRFLGLARAVFPNCKIINVTRNSKDVCWSNYVQYFAGEGNGFSNSLEDTVSMYNMYVEYMLFWKQSQIEFLNVNYENFVGNTEKSLKRIFSFLEIKAEMKQPTDDAPFVANTASNRQVNRKIYQTKEPSWKNYEQYITTAFERLII